MSETIKKYIRLAACVAGTSLLGIISKAFSGDIKAAYEAFEKPAIDIFASAGLYGFVWPIMYILMGLALFFLLNVPSLKKKIGALVLFGIQMAVNVAWSPIFFQYGKVWVAAGLIVLLDLLVFFMVISFSRYSDLSALFLLPYLLWMIYMTILTAAIILYNI